MFELKDVVFPREADVGCTIRSRKRGHSYTLNATRGIQGVSDHGRFRQE